MSPETLLENPSLTDVPSVSTLIDTFDTYVMNTYSRFPIAITKGQGCRLWDTEGKEYLDFVQ